jgi:hypothetical protein
MIKREYTFDDGQVARFSVSRNTEAGWEVREERDDRLVRRTRYTDWHRVELAMQVFELGRYDVSTKR